MNVTRAKLHELADRAKNAPRRADLRLVPRNSEALIQSASDFPRCVDYPDDHQGHRPRPGSRRVACSYCQREWESDGRGGMVRAKNEEKLR